MRKQKVEKVILQVSIPVEVVATWKRSNPNTTIREWIINRMQQENTIRENLKLVGVE